MEFVSSSTSQMAQGSSSMESSVSGLGVKPVILFNLQTGKPFQVPEKDLYGTCRSVAEFEKLNRVGEGTYGIVYRAMDTRSGKLSN